MEDLFSVQNKVTIVTGASRGIGYMIARGFVEAGARVYICARHETECDAAAAHLATVGECISIPADLSSVAGIDRFVGEIRDREPKLHVLVNNAGTGSGATIDEFPEAAWDKEMDLNLKAIFFLTSRLLALLRVAATAEDPARIINIGSVDGISIPPETNYAYSASKAAVHMLTRHTAYALVAEHITVNAIAPGLFPTEMTHRLFEGADAHGRVESIPMKRSGTPEDIAGTAIYLASRASAYMTGAILPLGGGFATIDRQG